MPGLLAEKRKRQFRDRMRRTWGSLTALRRVLYARDGGRCYWCGQPMAFAESTIEHIVPMSAGGSGELTNLTVACVQCNSGREARERKYGRNEQRDVEQTAAATPITSGRRILYSLDA